MSQCNTYSICIPESKIVNFIPKKTKDCATVIPGNISTYVFRREINYYKDYQSSYYAITCCKAGWDCLRHYEILANGCIPYFYDLEDCPKNDMIFLPKKLIKQAMKIRGVEYNHVYRNVVINHEIFNKKEYFMILTKLLEHTRKHLTTRAIAQYVLKRIGYTGAKPILF